MRLLKRYAAIILLVISALHTLSLPLVAEEMDKYIAIQKEGTGNIPLVLNTLDVRSKNDAGTARSLDAVLRAGLEFTDIFTLVPPPLALKSSVGNERGGVNFRALNTVEAEIYVGGKVTKKADGVTLTMEVYDISGSKLLFTQAYTGGEQQLRALGHAFCADLIEFFTGKSSVFGSKIVFVSNHLSTRETFHWNQHSYRKRLFFISFNFYTEVLSVYTVYVKHKSEEEDLEKGNHQLSIKKGRCML
jgi:TolB protein